MKKLLLSLVAIALFPLSAFAQVVGGKTSEDTIFFYGLTPSTTYYLGYSGTPMKRRLIANECGVLKIADSKTKKVADSYKVGSQTFQTWDNEFPSPPKCYQGQLKTATPQSFYVTRYDKLGNQFWDFYVLGLEPFSGHDVDYLENPTQYHSGKSDRCGLVRFAKNTTTKNFAFGAGDYLMLWDKDLRAQPFETSPAADLPVRTMPICRKGTLYSPR
jgi:hypothetical protein